MSRMSFSPLTRFHNTQVQTSSEVHPYHDPCAMSCVRIVTIWNAHFLSYHSITSRSFALLFTHLRIQPTDTAKQHALLRISNSSLRPDHLIQPPSCHPFRHQRPPHGAQDSMISIPRGPQPSPSHPRHVFPPCAAS